MQMGDGPETVLLAHIEESGLLDNLLPVTWNQPDAGQEAKLKSARCGEVASIRKYIFALVAWAPFIAVELNFVAVELDCEYFFRYANYIGDGVFALTGSLAAAQKGMDLFGCIVVGTVVALGGGTIRDVLLGNLPIAWMMATDEVFLCFAVSFVAFFCWPFLQLSKIALSDSQEWVFWLDAIGLGVFSATGAHRGFNAGLNVVACGICALSTACFGGVARDVLCQQPPRILYSTDEMYGLPPFLGGVLAGAYMSYFKAPDSDLYEDPVTRRGLCLAFATTVFIRVVCWVEGLKLPSQSKVLSMTEWFLAKQPWLAACAESYTVESSTYLAGFTGQKVPEADRVDVVRDTISRSASMMASQRSMRASPAPSYVTHRKTDRVTELEDPASHSHTRVSSVNALITEWGEPPAHSHSRSRSVY